MRILRPIAFHVGIALLAPWEKQAYAIELKTRVTERIAFAASWKGVRRDRILKNALIFAVRDARYDLVRHLFDQIFPLPTDITDTYSRICKYPGCIDDIRQSGLIMNCFIEAITTSNVQMLMFIRPLIDSYSAIQTAEHAIVRGNANALKLILRWHEDDGCKHCPHEIGKSALVGRITEAITKTRDLRVVKIVSKQAPELLNHEYVVTGLLHTKRKCELAKNMIALNRKKLRIIDPSNKIRVWMTSTVRCIVKYGDVQIIRILRGGIINDAFIQYQFTTISAQEGAISMLRLILSWFDSETTQRLAGNAMTAALNYKKQKTAKMLRDEFGAK